MPPRGEGLRVGATFEPRKVAVDLIVEDRPDVADKLRDRARRIVAGVTGLDEAAADALLRTARWNVKAAILMEQTGVTRATALSRLRVEPRLRKLLGR